jgi:hypothetical protein
MEVYKNESKCEIPIILGEGNIRFKLEKWNIRL